MPGFEYELHEAADAMHAAAQEELAALLATREELAALEAKRIDLLNAIRVEGDVQATVAATLEKLQGEVQRMTGNQHDDTGDGAQSPEGPSNPGPTYPHPEGLNDPVDPAEQQDKAEALRDKHVKENQKKN